MLKNAYAREFLGLATERGEPHRIVEEKETLKGLAKLMGDIADGMPVKKVYNSEQIRTYLDGFEKKNTPDRKKTLPTPTPLATGSVGKRTTAKSVTRSRPNLRDRKRLIPPGVTYSISHSRVNAIYHELRGLDVDTRRNAVAVLFRVFLELSAELYLDEHGLIFTSSDKLANKLGKAVSHMKQNSWLDRKGCKGIDSAISGKHAPHAVDTFHAYVHNSSFQPVPSDLNVAFDNLRPFFDCLFSHLS